MNRLFGFFIFVISLIFCYELKNDARTNHLPFIPLSTNFQNLDSQNLQDFENFQNLNSASADAQNSKADFQPLDELLYTHLDNLHADNFIVPNSESSAHASSILDLKSHLMLVFFAGSREGAEDVKIYKSVLAKNSKNWSYPQPILDAQLISKMSGKFIKKLGNPIIFKDAKERVHLFVVGVSLGGWATSKIYHLRFKDDEHISSSNELDYIGELQLSPFANLSHLVRTPAVMLENGGFMLPLYHELADKYALVAFFDENSEFRFSKRLNALHYQLQPSITALDSENCVAIFRTAKRVYDSAMFIQQCANMGNQWSDLMPTNLRNFDSSSVILNIDGEILLLHNDGLENPIVSLYESYGGVSVHPRASLSLFWMREFGVFERLASLDFSLHGGEVSYPSATADDEFLHIAYTLDRKNIKYLPISLDSVRKLIEQSRSNDAYFYEFEGGDEPSEQGKEWLKADDFILS